MVFNSMDFLVFFPLVVIVYFVIPAKVRWVWLLVTSYFFYACWNPQYIFLLAFSSVITYLSGILMGYIKKQQWGDRRKSMLLNISVAVGLFFNLFLLFYFKYFAFAISSANRIGNYIGLYLKIPIYDIILPIGISFYIFQTIGYMVDVRRGKIKEERNFFRYALFVAFFPQLLAGPIARSSNFLPQVNKPTFFDVENVREGLLTMAYGLFLKVVVADRIAVIVNSIYSGWADENGMSILTATILYAFQIYCDFEGYSQLAVGSAKVLGYNLTSNFNTPYLCTSVQDFWKRWHISLTSWFREYLYIPLGGNRKGRGRKYLNTMIVFLLSGLWHGASWHFVIWGGINGFYNIVQDATKRTRENVYKFFRINTNAFLWKIFCAGVTFGLVDLSWLFFRAGGVMLALKMLKRIYLDFNIGFLCLDSFYNIFGTTRNFAIIIISLIVVLIVDMVRRMGFSIQRYILEQQIIYRWVIYFAIVGTIFIFGTYGGGYEQQAQFIYFQF